jgi:hypothetical protein
LSLCKPPAKADKNNNQPVPPKDGTDPKSSTAPQQIVFVSNTIPSPQQSNCSDWGKKRTPGWEKAAVLVALGIFAVNAWQSWETRKSANAAQKAADTAATALELTQRPWVFVKDAKVISPLTFDKEGAHVTFEITLRNSGLSPAINIQIVPKLYPLPSKEETAHPVERLCNGKSYHGGSIGGMMLFPSTESPAQKMNVGLNSQEIAKAEHSGMIVITPFICVLYNPTFKDVGYSSGVQYLMWPTIWPDKTKSIPISALPLDRNGFFGESAH